MGGGGGNGGGVLQLDVELSGISSKMGIGPGIHYWHGGVEWGAKRQLNHANSTERMNERKVHWNQIQNMLTERATGRDQLCSQNRSNKLLWFFLPHLYPMPFKCTQFQ